MFTNIVRRKLQASALIVLLVLAVQFPIQPVSASAPDSGEQSGLNVSAVGAGIYDDSDVNWVYTGAWTAYSNTGPYSNTLHYSTTIGNHAQFTFNGSMFILIYTGHINRGTVDVYVDNVKISTLNQYASSLTWQKTWISRVFPSGVHTVKLVHASGGVVDVDAIQIPLPATSYDDIHGGWGYTGTWPLYQSTGPYNNTLHYSTTIGNYAQFTFNGSQFALTYTGHTNRGVLDIYIDDVKVHSLNQYSSTPLSWQQTWMSYSFASGNHTVKLEHASGAVVDVDAIHILTPLDPVAPAAIGDLTATRETASGTVRLNWKAPGDDGDTGTALAYLVRFSTSAITNERAWNDATAVTSGVPAPAVAHTDQQMMVAGLTPGATYFFAIRAYDEGYNLGAIGNSPSAMAGTGVPPVDNDDFSGAFSINSMPYANTQSTIGATSAVDDPVLTNCDGTSGKMNYTVWYKYQATSNGVLTVDTFGSDYDTLLAIWTGSRGSLTQIACDDESGLGAGQSRVKFNVFSGTTYYIEVAGYSTLSYGTLFLYATMGSPYDNTNKGWKYSPTSGWTAYTGTGPYNSTLHYSTTIGNFAEFNFDGSQFILTYTGHTNRGVLDIYVDEVKVHSLNQYAASLTWQKTWMSSTYTVGSHTVKLVHAGGAVVDVDAIQIINPSDISAPASIDDLNAVTGTTSGTVDLSWKAPGDDGDTGTASSYLVRYSTSAIISEWDWIAATVVATGIPVPAAANTDQQMTVSGLALGATYYFAIRAQDDSLNLGAVGNSPNAVAAVGGGYGPGVYDDTDLGLLYTGVWDSYTSVGSYDNSLRYSTTIGNYVQFTFTGSSFMLVYTAHTNRGTVDIYLDGSKIGTLNQYASSLAWQRLWASGTFAPGVHTVKLVHASGSVVDVDAVLIPFAPNKYDDSHSGWSFVGAWTGYTDTGPYNSTLHYSTVIGDYALFTFEGAQFTLTYTGHTNRGILDIYVDNVKVHSLNQYSSSPLAWQQTWTSEIFSTGVHTVKLVHATGSVVDVDAIEIPSPPVTYDDTNGGWGYTGVWTAYTSTGPYNGTLHYSTTIGNYAEFTFNGSRFFLTYTGHTNRGILDIYVDNVKVYSLNQYASILTWQKSWNSGSLTPGLHTVKFVHASGGVVDVDAIQYYP